MARKAKSTAASARYKKRSYKRKKKLNYEVIGIVLIAVSIFIGISFFTNTAGVVGEGVKSVSMGLLGFPAYFLCFIVIAAALHLIIRRNIQVYASKYWLCCVIIILISVLWHLASNPQGVNYWEMGSKE